MNISYISLKPKKQYLKQNSSIYDICYMLQERTNESVALLNKKKIVYLNKDNKPKDLKYIGKKRKGDINLYIFTSGHDQYMLFGHHHKDKLTDQINENKKNQSIKKLDLDIIEISTKTDNFTIKRRKPSIVKKHFN